MVIQKKFAVKNFQYHSIQIDGLKSLVSDPEETANQVVSLSHRNLKNWVNYPDQLILW